MNDHFFFHAVDHVPLFPGEVVMVLEVQQHFGAEIGGHVLVDERVVRRGVAAHQLHRRPVFLAFLRIQRQPRQALQLARQVRELAEGNLAVMVAHGRTRAAAAAVREQCHVSSRGADSDESGHLFQSISDTIPGLSDSCRSEATLWGSHKGVSDRSQGFATGFCVLIRSPSEGRRSGRQPAGAIAPSIRAGGERRERTLELQFAFPPVATRNGLTRPPE